MTKQNIHTIDRSGEPRSNDDLKAAILVVEKEIIKVDFRNPTLFVQLPVIRDALKELLEIRTIKEN